MTRSGSTTQPSPIWAGVGASPDSIDLAARLGLRLMLPTVFGSIEMFRRAVDFYMHAWDSYGHPRSAMRIGACHHTFVHADSAKARARWAPRYRAYIEWVNDLQFRSSGGRSNGLGQFDFDALIGETAVCGSPAEVVDRLGTIAEVLSLDTQILMFDMGGMPDGELFAAIELTGSHVIPELAGVRAFSRSGSD